MASYQSVFSVSFVISTGHWYPEIQFVILAIVVNQDAFVRAADLRFLMCHYGGHILQKSSIVTTCGFLTYDHGLLWVLRLLDLMLDCSKTVSVHTLLVAIR
jgi:hypothetical protein